MQYPSVTLTFAQSIDAKIAAHAGRQIILSGPQSMQMTHRLRSQHDAILIGVQTALNDDPQLNVRLLPAPDPGQPHHNIPRPIILDSDLRLSPTCRLLRNHHAGTGRRPWVICRPSDDGESLDHASFQSRKQALINAGARVIHTEPQNTPVIQGQDSPEKQGGPSIPIISVLEILGKSGIKSLMVEGGARVIGSFLANHRFIQSIIITVAPTFVGDNGVGYSADALIAAQSHFQLVRNEIYGKDTVFVFERSQGA